MDKKKICQYIQDIKEYLPLIYPTWRNIYVGTPNKKQINQNWDFETVEYGLKREQGW